MMQCRETFPFVVLLVLVLGLGLAGPSSAETSWLVLHGGQRIETRDGYEVRGRQVLFEDTAGRLRSLRVDEVDLEATRRAALDIRDSRDEGPQPQSDEAPSFDLREEQQDEPQPVLVLDMNTMPTQKDAERRRSRHQAAERKREVDRLGVAAMRAAGQRRTLTKLAGENGLATVEHWTVAPSRQTGGLRLVGELANATDRFLDRVEIRVRLIDEDGKQVGGGRGFVDQTRLRPGSASNFHWIDPTRDSLDGLKVEFRVTARALSWGAKPKYAANTIPDFPFAGKESGR